MRRITYHQLSVFRTDLGVQLRTARALTAFAPYIFFGQLIQESASDDVCDRSFFEVLQRGRARPAHRRKGVQHGPGSRPRGSPIVGLCTVAPRPVYCNAKPKLCTDNGHRTARNGCETKAEIFVTDSLRNRSFLGECESVCKSQAKDFPVLFLYRTGRS